jgi:hypothetical protein
MFIALPFIALPRSAVLSCGGVEPDHQSAAHLCQQRAIARV